MGSSDFEKIRKGVVKRTQKRKFGIFIDGVGLDRATRRLNRRIDFSALVKGVSSGLTPTVARYYTVIPYEDDARQFSFLDAIYKAGLEVILKRLPPKGVNRQVSTDIEMAADIIAFSKGHERFSAEDIYLPDDRALLRQQLCATPAVSTTAGTIETDDDEDPKAIKRVVTAVCPSRDLTYVINLANELGAETVTADFSKVISGNIMKAASKWMDLSDSETIWKD